MRTLAELKEEISNLDKQVASLEQAYEAEGDDRKGEIIWKRKDRAETRLDKLIDRADVLREENDNDDNDEAEHKADEADEDEHDEHDEDKDDCCPECGADLIEEADGTLYCERCEELYDRTEGE